MEKLVKPKMYRRIWKVIRTRQEAEAGLASGMRPMRGDHIWPYGSFPGSLGQSPFPAVD